MKSILTVVGIVFVTALMRLVPHVPNFVPITAVALFAGAHFTDKRSAIALVLSAMLLSDLVLGFHSLQPVVYFALALSVLIGGSIRGRSGFAATGFAATGGAVVGASLASSGVFFVVTNLGVFLLGELYPRTIAGLVACFTAAIPFFTHSVVSDLLFSALLFGAFARLREAAVTPA